MRTPTPSAPLPSPARSRRRGFTMIELLVVIGIIVILMSILIPAVGRVQIQARTADSRQQMSKISSALENYFKDYHAYPGALPNILFSSTTPPSGPNGSLTMTENGVLGLCGGLDIDSAGAPKWVYNEGNVGKGPVSFHPNPTKQKRSPAYIDPLPGQMTPPANGNNQWGDNGKTGVSDSQIPEFMDKYSPPRPILYMRANVGATGILPSGTSPGQYDPQWVSPYANSGTDFGGQMNTDYPDRPTLGLSAGWQSYLGHQTIPGVPRGQNTYILICAGPDGFYGTKDDLIYP